MDRDSSSVDDDALTIARPREGAEQDETSGDGPTAVAPRRRVDDRMMQANIALGLLEAPKDHEKVGRFVVLDLIGAGAMGSVYRAYDPRLDRRVALKVLAAHALDAEMSTARLLREATALARLNHPNVVTVHDAGREGDEVYLAMELVEGVDLAAWSARSRVNDPGRDRTALDIVCQAARGLAAAHRAGIIHRDFKPANVLIGSDGRVRVADFGLARTVRHGSLTFERPHGAEPDHFEPTKTGMILGTPRYMAPEQRRGDEIDARADQFAFCSTAWEVLWGRHPFGDLAPSDDPIPPPAGAPPRLVAALRQGLRVDPRERHASMDVLLSELEACRAGPSAPRRSGLRIAVAIALCVAVAAAFGYAMTQADRSDENSKREQPAESLVANDRHEVDERSSNEAAASPTPSVPPVTDDPARPPDDATQTPESSPSVEASDDPTPRRSGRPKPGTTKSDPEPDDDDVLDRVRAAARRACRGESGASQVAIEFLIESTGRAALLRSAGSVDGRSRCVEAELRPAKFRAGASRRATLRVSFDA